MEIRIVIFLAFTSVTVIANTLAILVAYRLFSKAASRMTETMSEFQKSSETREWIASMHAAAERAKVITEATKVKFAEFDPVLSRAQENYRHTLVTLDSKFDQAAEKITTALCSFIARSITRVTFSPTAEPIEPPIKFMSIAAAMTG